MQRVLQASGWHRRPGRVQSLRRDLASLPKSPVIALIDDNVPLWAKMLMPSDVPLKIARTVLKAVDEAHATHH